MPEAPILGSPLNVNSFLLVEKLILPSLTITISKIKRRINYMLRQYDRLVKTGGKPIKEVL